LNQKFEEQLIKTQDKKRFNELLKTFSDSESLNWFKESPFYKERNATYEAYYDETHQLKGELESLKKEISLFNIDENNSLIQWVIQRGNPLSKKQEALLFHGLEMPLSAPSKPKLYDKFIVNPALFIESAHHLVETSSGFWWTYHGIRAFVSERAQYIFGDLSQLAAHFKQKHAEHKKEIAQLEIILKKREMLSNTLHSIHFKPSDIDILKDKNLQGYVFNVELAKETKESLYELLELYQNREDIDTVYKDTQETYLKAMTAENANEALLTKTNQNLAEQETRKVKLTSQLTSYKQVKKQSDDAIHAIVTKVIMYCVDYHAFVPNYILKFTDTLEKLKIIFEKMNLQQEDISNKKEILLENKGIFNTQKTTLERNIIQEEKLYVQSRESKEAKQYGLNDFNEESYSKISENVLTELETVYEKALSAYEKKYDDLATTYKNDLTRNFEFKSAQNRDTFALAKALLGNMLIRYEDTFEADLSNKIEARIKDINEQLRDINAKNEIHIKGVLKEIISVHNKYEFKCIRYNHFLKANKLTNDRYVEVDFRKDKVFQLSWIKDIIKQIDANDNTFNLFEQEKEATSKNVNEILINMFKKTVKQAHLDTQLTIENLLDPKSYFDLGIHLKLADGTPDSQSGGTGHGMIILISAARFVLMQQKQKNKKMPKGLRYIPIDEVADLGENFELLREIAKKHGFQLIIFSIDSFGRIEEQEGIYSYELRKPIDPKKPRINPTPLAIFNMRKGMTDMDHLEEGDEFVQNNYQDFLLNFGIADGN
jgi:DNA repair protein SbcC/Rad50